MGFRVIKISYTSCFLSKEPCSNIHCASKIGAFQKISLPSLSLIKEAGMDPGGTCANIAGPSEISLQVNQRICYSLQ